MATKKGSDNRFPLVRLTYEDDTPATPPADEGHLVAGVDKVLRWIDDDGTVTELGAGGASTLATLTDVDLTGVADGDVLTYDSGGSEWLPVAPTGGGGGGGRGEYASKYNPDHETPTTTPDFAEEANGSIDGGWSWSSAPATTDATTYPGFYHVRTSGTGDYWMSRAFAPGAVDLTIAAKLSAHNIANANTPFIDIGFGGATGATPAEAAMFRLQVVAGNQYLVQAVDRTGGAEAGNTSRGAPELGWDISHPLWVRLTRTQSTGVWRYYYSLDGITWSPEAYMGTRTKSLTVASIFVRMNAQSMALTLDWLRVWDSIIEKVGA